MVSHINILFWGLRVGQLLPLAALEVTFNLTGWALVFPAVKLLRQDICLHSLVEIAMEVSDKN